MKHLLIIAGAALLLPTISLADSSLGRPGQPAQGNGGPVVRVPSGGVTMVQRRRPSRNDFMWRGRRWPRMSGAGFRYPPGLRYRRWRRGAVLPSRFMTGGFFWDGWGPAGFGAPPPGQRWVRNGPDLILVDMRSRRIVDVIYGAFF